MTAPGAQSSSIFRISLSVTSPVEPMLGRECGLAEVVVRRSGLAHLCDLDPELGFGRSLLQPLGCDLAGLHLPHGLLPLREGRTARLIEETKDLLPEYLERVRFGGDVEEHGPERGREVGQRFVRALAVSREAARTDALHPELAVFVRQQSAAGNGNSGDEAVPFEKLATAEQQGVVCHLGISGFCTRGGASTQVLQAILCSRANPVKNLPYRPARPPPSIHSRRRNLPPFHSYLLERHRVAPGGAMPFSRGGSHARSPPSSGLAPDRPCLPDPVASAGGGRPRRGEE